MGITWFLTLPPALEHVFRLGPCFFLSISQTKLLRMCLFPCEAYDSRKGGQTHYPKKQWKEKTMSTIQQFLAKQPPATQGTFVQLHKVKMPL